MIIQKTDFIEILVFLFLLLIPVVSILTKNAKASRCGRQYSALTIVINISSLSISRRFKAQLKMNKQKRSLVTIFPWQRWEGLSGWNYYFLLKFGLLWGGYLNFHALANLVFACVLIYPITSLKLRKFRSLLMFPIGIGLFYHDTWLPGIESSSGSRL